MYKFIRHTGKVAPEIRDSGHGTYTWDPGPSTWDASPGTWDPGLIARTRDPGPLRGTRDMGPYTWDLSPGTLYVGTLDQSKKSDFFYLPQVGFI